MKKFIYFIGILLLFMTINVVKAASLEVEEVFGKDNQIEGKTLQSITDSENNYITTNPGPSFKDKSIVKKYGENKQIKWETELTGEDVRDISIDSKNNIYVLVYGLVSIKYSDEYIDGKGSNSVIYVLDSKNGEIINTYRLTDDTTGEEIDSMIIKDDYIYVTGTRENNFRLLEDYPNEHYNKYSTETSKWIIKYDLDFNKKWEKNFGSKIENSRLILKKTYTASATVSATNYRWSSLEIKDDKIYVAISDSYAIFSLDGKKIADNIFDKTYIKYFNNDGENNILLLSTKSKDIPFVDNPEGKNINVVIKIDDNGKIISGKKISIERTPVYMSCQNNKYIIGESKKIYLYDKNMELVDEFEFSKIDTPYVNTIENHNKNMYNGVFYENNARKGLLFEIKVKYDAKVKEQNDGKITLEKEQYEPGEKVVFEIEPKQDYIFKELKDIETNKIEENKYYFTMPEEDIELIPIFQKKTIINKVIEKIEKNPETGDSILLVIISLLILSLVVVITKKKLNLLK